MKIMLIDTNFKNIETKLVIDIRTLAAFRTVGVGQRVSDHFPGQLKYPYSR